MPWVLPVLLKFVGQGMEMERMSLWMERERCKRDSSMDWSSERRTRACWEIRGKFRGNFAYGDAKEVFGEFGGVENIIVEEIGWWMHVDGFEI